MNIRGANKIYLKHGPKSETSSMPDTKWYLNGALHQKHGPSIDEYSNGSKAWFLDNQLHREDGPAVENPGGTI
jgi:hypothetical protein